MFLNHVRIDLLLLLYCSIHREITYYVCLPGEIFLSCLGRDWYPNSAAGVGKAKTNLCFQGCCVTYSNAMFSVICGVQSLGRNKDVFCMFGVAQGKSGQGLCVLMSTWKCVGQSTGHPLSGQCSVDWTNSHHARVYWQDHQWGLSRAQHCSCSSDGYYAFESRMGTLGWMALFAKEHPFLASTGNHLRPC